MNVQLLNGLKNREAYKKISMRYLIIGISLSIISLSSCNEREEKLPRLELAYQNQTDYFLEFYSIHPVTLERTLIVSISANNKTVLSGDGYANGQTLLDAIGYPTIAVFDLTNCVTFEEGQGPNDFQNFLQTDKITYTYSFTNEILSMTEACD